MKYKGKEFKEIVLVEEFSGVKLTMVIQKLARDREIIDIQYSVQNMNTYAKCYTALVVLA